MNIYSFVSKTNDLSTATPNDRLKIASTGKVYLCACRIDPMYNRSVSIVHIGFYWLEPVVCSYVWMQTQNFAQKTDSNCVNRYNSSNGISRSRCEWTYDQWRMHADVRFKAISTCMWYAPINFSLYKDLQNGVVWFAFENARHNWMCELVE